MSDEDRTAWVEEELESIDLGDERLGKRCQLLLKRFAADAQASVNGACRGWSESVGAYRFFDHEAVDEHRVLQPHRDATLKRMEEHPVVLVVQDTTELDYTSRRNSLRGAGPLNDETRVGFYDHLQVAFTPHRLCLGVLAMEVWARDWETFRTCKERKYDPIQTKESYRWLQGYRRACQIAEQLPQTQIVSVADREADIYECFLEAQQPAPPKRAEACRNQISRQGLSVTASSGMPSPTPRCWAGGV
jgi:hypothetical protein